MLGTAMLWGYLVGVFCSLAASSPSVQAFRDELSQACTRFERTVPPLSSPPRLLASSPPHLLTSSPPHLLTSSISQLNAFMADYNLDGDLRFRLREFIHETVREDLPLLPSPPLTSSHLLSPPLASSCIFLPPLASSCLLTAADFGRCTFESLRREAS